MKKPSDILPFQVHIFIIQVGSFKIQPITWEDFKGEVEENMKWSAHIYWYIDYKITDLEKKKVTAKLHLSPKSWVR